MTAGWGEGEDERWTGRGEFARQQYERALALKILDA